MTARDVIELANRFIYQEATHLEGWSKAIGLAGLQIYGLFIDAPGWLDTKAIVQAVGDPKVPVTGALSALYYHGLVVPNDAWSQCRRGGDLFREWYVQEVRRLIEELTPPSPNPAPDPPFWLQLISHGTLQVAFGHHIAQANPGGRAELMDQSRTTRNDQRQQVVGTQYNADHITIYPPVVPLPMQGAAGPPPVDVVIITPLEEERDAVLAKLEGLRQLPPTADDIRVYFAAELPVMFPDGATATYRVVVMPLLNMGRVEAANATGDAIRRWRPRYVWLVGIAGGLAKAGVALGDVLIADQVADYELQKLTPEATSIRWQVHRVDPRLLGAARNLRGDGWLKLITGARPAAGAPRRHIGAICTGDKVIANNLLDAYQDVWAKLVGVEMEAGGTASAAFQAANIPGFFMVRGVSDLADAAKDSDAVDRWRAYACDVAAAYAIGLLRSGPIPLATAAGADRPR